MAQSDETLQALLKQKLDQAQNLFERCDLLTEKNIGGAAKLKRKVQAELEFLNQLKTRPATLKPNHVISTNLTHLNALFDAANNQSNVIAVLAPFERGDEKRTNLIIDVVADGGATWFKVVARSARGLHFTWAGEASYQERGILDQARDYCSIARENPFMFKSPKVVFLFCAGVTQPIADDLRRKFQIESRGDIVPVDPSWGLMRGDEHDDDEDDVSDSDQTDDDEDDEDSDDREANGNESRSEDEEERTLSSDQPPIDISGANSDNIPINLDITAFIVYVSALTNANGAQYRFKEPLLDEQATWERENPALHELRKYMDPDSKRELICCQTAYESFMEILNTVGGPAEKERSKALLERVKIVDDHVSDRMLKLQSGGKIKERSKVVFGSGDFYQAVTLTANRGFVHAAAFQGFRLATIFHESRALSEQKQLHAVPLSEFEQT